MENELLTEAFKEFARASDSIISYYDTLKTQISQLKEEVERKNRELEEAGEYLGNILNSLPIGVVVLDRKKIAFANKSAERLGVNILTPEITNGKKTGEMRDEKGLFRWKKDGLTNGFSGKEVVVIEDVTELEKVKERTERDERLMAMGEMAARIAHEIKNPLCSMELFAGLLLDKKRTRKDREYLEYIQYGIKTIDTIINNVLSYTRPKALVPKKESLTALVRGIVDFMEHSVSGRGIGISFESSFDGLSIFDPDFIRLVAMNLISNAKEAMDLDQGGEIKVGVNKNNRYVTINVTDNGPGIPESLRRYIFDPFFTTKDKGVGLGLFTVHNIVRAHGGYVEVEDAKPRGTSFTVSIPAGETA